VHEGTFSIPIKSYLKSLQTSLAIGPEIAAAIEAEICKPYQEFQRKLREYEETLEETVREEAVLDERVLNDLIVYQTHLGLRDEDVQAMNDRILQPKLASTFKFETATIDRNLKITHRQGRAEFFREALGNGVDLDLVKIPAGQFMMGAVDKEKSAKLNEYPQHLVRVPTFYMGIYPVTQAQWAAIAALPKIKQDLRLNPSHFKGADRPVELVNWLEAVEFCERLSKKTGRTYRLPSEAEWEYACRSSTTTPFHFGETITPDLANYNGNYAYGTGQKGQYRGQTSPVGQFPANGFGLYDLHGSIWEWCFDHWHETYQGATQDGSAWITNDNDTKRILRGGSWDCAPVSCRAAHRIQVEPARRGRYFGFRVSCSAATILL
jgi:formylglycine-generating enzyme required for sulfatase activity